MSPESSTGPLEITIQPRLKKPPACDYCRTRRVLCHPQPEGRSCPRCLEKGVKCTTTPSVRKKRRRQHEILSAKKVDDAGTSQGQELAVSRALTVTTSAAQYAPRITHMLATCADLNDVYRRPIVFAPVSSRPQLQLPKRLMQDLFNDFCYIPYRLHPIMPFDRVRARLAGCGWQPSSLSPQECVLVHCIFALASTVSIDPLIIGPEPFPKECINILSIINPVKNIKSDLREIGRRRESVGLCQQLRVEALRQAQNEAIAVSVSLENAASCFLLDILVSQYAGPNSYGAVFAWQTRRLAESWYQQPQLYNWIFGTVDCSTKWAAVLMFDVLEGLHSDRSSAFLTPDEQLICGHDQLSLENLASLLSQGCNSWQFYGYYISITFQITRLAREIYERIRGPYTRGRPYDLQLIKHYTASLHLLHDVCNALHKQGVLLARQNQSQNFTILAFVRAVSIGWTNLTLHFYKTMKEMLAESSVTDLYYTTTSGGPWHGPGIDIIDGLDGLERGTYSYSSSLAELELTPIFLAVRTLTCKAAIDHSEMIEDIYSISRFTQTKIVGGDLKRWVEFVIDMTDSGVMSASEGIQTLERLRDGLKIAGFTWRIDTDLVEVIDSHVSALMDSSSASAQDPAHMHIFTLDNPDLNYHHTHLNPHPDPDSQHTVLQSGSATQAAAHPDLAMGYDPDIDSFRNLEIISVSSHMHVPPPQASAPGPGPGISPYDHDPLVSGYTYAYASARSSTFFKS
ncbi:hypothetical protein D9758_004319 [Tetrapyrgos nigripes]|uniref:Zn(2)-C6 fungal-type domain-containing protein n=1 Tax=Tetrapyrgos nigripes TaxID=182062 RepID=A0A8H5GUC7_9AGAR|nr:hypothetical protein D9758_004319 [Tetrapyrgos nigripes]